MSSSSFVLAQKDCDEIQNHPSFPIRAIADRALPTRAIHRVSTRLRHLTGSVSWSAHFVQSPRKMSSHSRKIRLPREREVGLGTSYHSMSSTLPQRSQIKW